MMQVNRYAQIPNPLSAERYQELKSSIGKYGQHIPIVLYQNEILDGRHRYQACIELGIEPKFENRDDVDPCQYVKDALPLREFTASVRAFTFAELDKVKIEEMRVKAAQSRDENQGRPKLLATLQAVIDDDSFPDPPAPKKPDTSGWTNHAAAKEANVSPRTMADAIKVSEKASEPLKVAVMAGNATVSQAAAIADLPVEMQKKAVETNTVKELAKEAPEIKRQAPKQAEYITLENWKTLTLEQQNEALKTDSDKTFNRQDGDSIEWAQWSWNPITGCLHGCPYCYAKGMAERFFTHKFEPSIIPDRLTCPQNTKISATATVNQKNVFTGSMTDLMGAWQPTEWINAVISSMVAAPQFNFLLLTKNPKRYLEFEFPENCWLGATIDCQARVDDTLNILGGLKHDKGMTTWVSFEPLLEQLEFSGMLSAINWAVIGGQTGPRAFLPEVDWWSMLHIDARSAGCAIYHKANLGLILQARNKEFPERRKQRD